MVLKPSQKKFTNPNKNVENDSNESEELSQSLHEVKKRSRSLKKKKEKERKSKSPNNTTSNQQSRSLSFVARSLPLVPILPPPVVQVPAMTSYYTGRTLPYRYPVPTVSVPDWNITTRMRFQNSVYTVPYQPVPIWNPQVLPSMYPCPGYTYFLPALTPMLPPPVVIDDLSTVSNCQNVYTQAGLREAASNEICETYNPELVNTGQEIAVDAVAPIDHLDFYLSLPKQLFPTAMMLSLDPNPIVDEFCKYSAVSEHVPWILDLEFGVPREATTRPIAIYDVKYNRVHCKNTPDAIHPGFESCDQGFKSMLTFYYDCVISTWYRGYMFMNQDKSVENFQSWLCPPMQEFGMCWP